MIRLILIFAIGIVFGVTQIFAEKLNSEWVRKDGKILKSAVEFIQKNDFSDSEIQNFLRSGKSGDWEPETELRGFGLKKSVRNFYGGYMTLNVTYIYYDDKPCKLIFSVGEEAFGKIKASLVKKTRKDFQNLFELKTNNAGNFSYSEYRFERDFSENYEKFAQHKKSIVGEIKNISIPGEYQKYYDFLFSAESSDEYGYIGGEAAQKTTGTIALEKLLELKDKNVFLNLLKGDSPSGRMYAAEGLLTLENSQASVDAINKVFLPLIAEGVTYSTIDGCFVETGVEYRLFEYKSK